MKQQNFPGQQDMAGLGHWEGVWRRAARSPYKSVARSLTYGAARLRNLFSQYVPCGAKVLEIGCGGSRWLPFLARRLGCEVWGIDYSEEGTRLCRTYLTEAWS